MTRRQIQPTQPNNRDYPLAQRIRPRSLIGQVSMVLLQPGLFFRTLPALESARQWVWIALIILALVGLSAVRQDELAKNGGGGFTLPSISTDSGASVGPGAGGGGIFGAPPPSNFGGPSADVGVPSAPTDVAATWTTALIAASTVILGWLIQAVLLCEVSLFNGVGPRLSHNLQIAIWATLPLAMMAALQLVFYAAGGPLGQPGVSGLLAEWSGYADLPPFVQSLLLSLTSRLTLFWLWSLALLYIGARQALDGKAWAVLVVVALWAILVVVMPVVTGTIRAPERESLGGFGNIPLSTDGLIDGGSIPLEGTFGLSEATEAATGEPVASDLPEAAPGT